MYYNGKELLELAISRDVRLSDIILENEMRISGKSEMEIKQGLKRRYVIMEESAQKALTMPQDTVGAMISGDSKKINDYAERGLAISGDFIGKIMARALSCCEVNASMGRICAAPTAGSCGIVPAVIISVCEKLKLDEDSAIRGLITCSGIGAIIVKNATVAGAEGGCQAECGAAAAMTAAAVVEMAGGTPEMCLNAAAIALKNILGLICDPVAGLVEVPCAKRNASQAVNAVTSADLALAGIKSNIPFDEVVEAMYNVGKMLPYQLRETALGGLAATKTAKKISSRIYSK
ncbi:MAG TPA: L-serine ammonia-lyase, iron-sulfur-dependent, subunit alpha [Ruminiclostridium sp.]